MISKALRKLSLAAKLDRNCKIEIENAAREAQTIKHLDDPAQNPDPGSEAASLISIEDDDIQALRTPTFASKFPNIPMAIQKLIAQLEAKDKDITAKKRDASDAKLTSDEAREAKRRCKDTAAERPHVPGEQRDVVFAEILYDTDDALLLPLPFFLNVNLQWLIDDSSTLLTTKTNPKAGETKGSFILDIEKAWSKMRCGTKEADMTYGQWHEAADNCFHFNAGHDKVGEEGPYAKWWENHFGFFDSQNDKIEQFPAWRPLEEKLRKAYRSQPTTFSREFYADEYRMARLEHRMQLRFDATRSRQQFPQKSSFQPPTRPRSQSPFPSGSKKPAASPSCCLACGERGHPLRDHYTGANRTKPLWVRVNDGDITHPDNGKRICIVYNIYGAKCTCRHGDEVLHACSLCGKEHHTFSWTCQKSPPLP